MVSFLLLALTCLFSCLVNMFAILLFVVLLIYLLCTDNVVVYSYLDDLLLHFEFFCFMLVFRWSVCDGLWGVLGLLLNFGRLTCSGWFVWVVCYFV